MDVPLSVLDLSPVGAGVSPSEAIRESIQLARAADRLGYTRYWFAEHHNMANIATSAPEVLIAHAAAVTTRIRVGAGGIMVPNHAPLHVVEVFRTLEALHPGRIDLGLGRAPGTDALTSQALRRETADVNQLLGELLAFERGQFPERHPFAQITPMPSDVRLPSIWMLGSTLTGASIAAKLGVPFAFAGHFTMTHAKDAIAHYRGHFVPSPQLAEPYPMLAVTTVCGIDDVEADRLAAPMRVAVVNSRTGRRAPIPTIEEALSRTFSAAEQTILDEFFAGAVIGGPATVGERLRALARDYDASELMLSTLVPGLDARVASLERSMAAMR
ncbi:MAG TPA: LLM class flavin-dependent oxidoreductase [Candidatus Binatia bacterium]|jgi:luciferase family oxidoreductase group 1|nr:LLM class flavin-dependent oxidoreductase [Candidatus Binatia bacterium]